MCTTENFPADALAYYKYLAVLASARCPKKPATQIFCLSTKVRHFLFEITIHILAENKPIVNRHPVFKTPKCDWFLRICVGTVYLFYAMYCVLL